MTLNNALAVVNELREAEFHLRTAAYAATETEGDEATLVGPTAHIIGGLQDVVGALADHIEEVDAADG